MCQRNEMLGSWMTNGKMPISLWNEGYTVQCTHTVYRCHVTEEIIPLKKISYKWMKMCGWTDDEDYEEVYDIAHQWIGQNGKQMDKLNAKLLFDEMKRSPAGRPPSLKCVIA